MLSLEAQEVARQSEAVYEQHLKTQLEPAYQGQFVAIEPISGAYFLGRTIYDAAHAAQQAYPDRLNYVIRIGHPVAIEIGNSPA
jgi:hypothetical protein